MRHNLRMICIAFLCGITPYCLSYSQTPAAAQASAQAANTKTGSEAVVETIRAEAVAFASAYNKGDAKAVAAFWTIDGEYIDEAGQAYVGREAIEALYKANFAESKSTLQLMPDSVRMLSSSAAIEDGRALVEPAPPGSAGISSYTAVHVKVDGKWLMASVRDTGSDTSAAAAGLTDLEFLIGDWMAEENGVRTDSKCRWIVNKKFVERSYTTTQLDGTLTTGLQIIGWSSQGNHIQSWTFTADGGHAIGVWSATDGGWLAKVNGTTGESISTTALNLLKRLDDNAYIWQSVNRTIGDVQLPDTDEVVIRREPAAK